MNFEYLFLTTQTIKEIAALNITHLHKLFLYVTVRQDHIYLHPDYRELLQKLDPLKVVLVVYEINDLICSWQLKANYISMKAWTGQYIRMNSNYLYKDYNFINSNQILNYPECLLDKINVLLTRRPLENINDKLRLIDCQIYINLIVVPKYIDTPRSSEFYNGIYIYLPKVGLLDKFQHIQLIGDAVYLKPEAVYVLEEI